jgi:8-oxo-dGTP pyrophosphatase MutT (NUDIX family)
VAALFDGMTREELLDVWSLNFEQMWYRIWLTNENREFFNKKYAKFQTAFMREDGGATLRRLVLQARASGVRLWEVPKGRRLGPRESDALCAVRELREETGVNKKDYHILPGVKRRVSYLSGGTRYVCIYYIALANPRLAGAQLFGPGQSTLRSVHHMAEVGEVRWYDIEQIRLVDTPNSRLEPLISPAFRLVKQYLRGRWASRRGDSPPAASPARAPTPARPDASEGWKAPQPRARARGRPAPTRPQDWRAPPPTDQK